MSKEVQVPGEVGEVREMDFPLELPEQMQPCCHLDCSPVRTVSDF